MSEYKQYITSINKIFDYLSKMKAGWNNLDNFNYVSTIEEYKEAVINNANNFSKEQTISNKENKIESLEALGDD